MNFLANLGTNYQWLEASVVLVVTVGLAIKAFSSGDSQLKDTIIKDYKERNGQLDQQIQDMGRNIEGMRKGLADMGSEIKSLQATLAEKDKRIDDLTRILEARNPDLLSLLNEIKTSNIEVMKFMKVIYPIIKKTGDETHKQTQMLENGSQKKH